MYINTNSIELYYEKSGQGSPIILLHGNGEDHTIFDVLIKQLSENFTVYAIDSRAHGKSSKTKELGYTVMMEDVAAFIEKLNIEKPVLYGFSDGGIIGLLLAIEHPEILSKLIISGANTTPSGVKKQWVFLMKLGFFFTRSSKLKLMLTEPRITETDLAEIITPTLVLAGEKDIIYEEHTKAIASNIKHSQLKILTGENHASYVINSGKLYEIIKPFLSLS